MAGQGPDDLARDPKERGAHAARFLSLAPDAVGGMRMKGYGTLEDAELIRTVLQHHHTLTHQTPWEVRTDPVTRQPIWTPPPPVPISDRITYYPPQRTSPMVA